MAQGSRRSFPVPPAMAVTASVLLILIFVLLGICVARSSPFNRPAVFNFGDSNSDTGCLVSAGFETINPPYGHRFFGHPSGRYCDGRLIVDFLCNFPPCFRWFRSSLIFSPIFCSCFRRCLIDANVLKFNFVQWMRWICLIWMRIWIPLGCRIFGRGAIMQLQPLLFYQRLPFLLAPFRLGFRWTSSSISKLGFSSFEHPKVYEHYESSNNNNPLKTNR